MDFYYIGVKLATGLIGLWFITKLLGKKEISQLTAFDFVSSLMLSEIVGNTLYDRDVPLHQLLYALALWGALSYGLEKLVQVIPGLSRSVNGTADIIIKQGRIDYKAMRKNQLDFDQLHTLLREQHVFSVRDVAYAIFETNGNISVMKKSPASAGEGEDGAEEALPVVVIENGRVQQRRLSEAGYDEAWLRRQLQSLDIARPEDVLYAEWQDGKGMHAQRKSERSEPGRSA